MSGLDAPSKRFSMSQASGIYSLWKARLVGGGCDWRQSVGAVAEPGLGGAQKPHSCYLECQECFDSSQDGH